MAECLCPNHALPEPPNMCVEGLTPSVSFLKKNYLLGYNCFTTLCQFLLYNRVNQLYMYTYPFSPGSRSLPPIPPLQVTAEHRVELPALHSRFPLSICFTHGGVYASPNLPVHPVSMPPRPHVCSILLPWKQVHQYHFSRFHMQAVI